MSQKNDFWGFCKTLKIRCLKRRKIQGTYFKISALYFKIYGLYFFTTCLMCFFAWCKNVKKTGFCGWKNKNKTDRNAIGFYVHLIGLEPTQPKLPDPKSGASTNSATGARCLELQI